MKRQDGIWQLFIPGLSEYEPYKYALLAENGDILYRADPYAFHCETRPGTCSKLFDISHYCWRDEHWFAFRNAHPLSESPFHLYEVHLGSWRRTGQDEPLSYTTLASFLIPYVKEMGYTGVVFMPLLEHQEDSSYGYAPDSWFAPTSRFGTPTDLMHLVDELHQAGVSVFMDWPCAFFSVNEHGLSHFDGSPLFEPPHCHNGVHHPFDFTRAYVRDFLLTSALFWLEQYHLDGLRICGVPDSAHPCTNAFFHDLHQQEQERCPGSLLLTDTPRLAADLTCAQGWVDDVLTSIPSPDASSEVLPPMVAVYPAPAHSILALDHRLLEPRGGSLVAAMPGNQREKMALSRLVHMLLLSFPGKKLSFMSNEFGQERRWDYRHSLDWHLLHYEIYHRQQAFFRDANALYLTRAPLWQRDDEAEGFSLLPNPALNRKNLLVIYRYSRLDSLFVVFNFSTAAVRHIRIGVERTGYYRVLLNSDACIYGGDGRGSYDCIPAEAVPLDGMPCSVQLDIAPVSGVMMAFDRPPEVPPTLLSPC
jgi:1,4-alpha-glucan branching enzyme